MEYKVLVPFIYTPTGKGYNEGSTFATDDSERIFYLVDNGFLEAKEVQITPVVETVNLKEQAKALKIKGYTKMTDEELKVAIEKAEAQKVSD